MMLFLSTNHAVVTADQPGFLRHRRINDEGESATDSTAPADDDMHTSDASSSSTSTNASIQCQPCPVCDTASIAGGGKNSTVATPDKIKLRFLVAERSFARLQVMLEQMAEDYKRKLGASAPEITVVGLPSLAELEREVKFDVLNGASQFDGYIITPLWIGELATGLFETSTFMKDYAATDPTYWTDILLFYREVISSYDNKLYLFPFDGDVISLFYRRDLLEQYGKDVPKTWDEYNELAAFFHGKTDTIRDPDTGDFVRNVTLSGSCIGRTPACGNPYWAQTVLASMTQVNGAQEGSMLDSRDLSPLLGPAMEETLRLQGEQTRYGVPEEFDGCVGVHVDAMNQGSCVLTYNWGNSFSDHIRNGTTVKGKLGVAPTPGSHVVLNRETGELEECISTEMCPHAILDERTGRLINQAPYGAYGGFSGAVSASVSRENQIAAAEFFAFATSAKKAIKYVIPDANNPDANPVPTGMDPYTKSMLDVNEWTSRGFDEKSAQEYKYAIESQLGSSNVVIDLRIPAASDFMAALDDVTTKYCNDTKFGKLDDRGNSALVRAEISAKLAERWRGIVTDFDRAKESDGALLELYQRDRGVYVPPRNIFDGYTIYESGGIISNGAIVAIVICITIVLAIVISITACFVKQSTQRKREDMWYVNPDDVHDTKEVLGRGSFGIVTKGFLRGTPVALKHAKGWEPDTPVVDGEKYKQKNNESDSIRRSLSSKQSSLSDKASTVDDSMIGTTLLTEASTTRGNWFYNFRHGSRNQQKKKCADDFLRAELLLIVKLRHDNIVQTLGASQDGKKKQLVLILQYMENGPIRNVLKDPNGIAGTAGMSLEIQWALQVARGANFLHTIPTSIGGPMVHADLKSSNVLLDSSYNANISDFGLATKTMGGLWGAIQRKSSNNPRGSILWMAPEVLNGAEPTPASDVYSYSMFLVELMTRDRPYGVKAFEIKDVIKDGKGDAVRHMSEISADTKFDRKRFSESGESIGESTISEQDGEDGHPHFAKDDDQAISTEDSSPEISTKDHGFANNIGDEEISGRDDVNQTKKPSTKRRMGHRVSWSVGTDGGDAAVAAASTTGEIGDCLKNTGDVPGTRFISRGFYANINGDVLSRDDIVMRVKDMTLDPPFRPTLPDNAPQILVDICTECWQKNPKRRPTMKEVEERLEMAVSSTSLTQQLMRRGMVFDTIIPVEMQDKLSRGEAIKPQTHDHVTVIFSDIVGFTSISSALTAEQVGDLISRLFTKFDNLCKINGVKKLDVIGDAFLGVVGVPHAIPNHASCAGRFALDAIKAAQDTLICPAKPTLGYAKVRFGLASGSAVATVIGTREHPKYTLFGDTVNIASRMESSGLPNRCQVTQVTADLIRGCEDRDGDSVIRVVYRGKMEVKGKGEMETFFLSD